MQPVDPEAGPGPADIRLPAFRDVPAVHPLVHLIKDKKKDHHIKEKDREQMQAPEERDAAHKSHQQRRIADRGQDPAHVGHEENEEHHNVRFSSSPGVHFQHGTDHEHAGACCPDAACQQGPEDEKSGVDPGGTREIPFHCNIAGYAEQSEQQDDKCQIIIYRTVQYGFRHLSGPVVKGEWDCHDKDPESHRERLMAAPPFLFDKRHDGDAEQQPCKWDAQPDRDRGILRVFRCLDAYRADDKDKE